MLREYCVFNVAQCKGLPASIVEGKPARVRNPDGRDPLADEFLASSGQSSARVQARLTMRQGKTSSACPPSLPSKAQTISTALPVPSGMRLEFGGGISGNMRLSFQAARSIG
jgi:hypothetical protein